MYSGFGKPFKMNRAGENPRFPHELAILTGSNNNLHLAPGRPPNQSCLPRFTEQIQTPVPTDRHAIGINTHTRRRIPHFSWYGHQSQERNRL